MTPTQWQATVQRMITEKGAEITPDAQTQIIAYLTSAARANAGLTAELSIASDAPIGAPRSSGCRQTRHLHCLAL